MGNRPGPAGPGRFPIRVPLHGDDMSIEERLMSDLKDAMRAGAAGERRKSTIRMARAAIQNAQIDAGHPLGDAEVVQVLQREVKKRRDAVDEYERVGRADR